jgi:acetyl-CoA synthetase
MEGGRDVWYHDVIPPQPATCPPEWVHAEHPLFLLYTSGSTGKPKGVLHTTAGYMLYAATTCKYVFNMKPGDVYWCTADCGWITGHTYLTYGPLLNGVASLVFEGVPSYPGHGRLWEVVAKHKVQQFYTAPTAIRALMCHGDDYVTAHDRSSIEVRSAPVFVSASPPISAGLCGARSPPSGCPRVYALTRLSNRMHAADSGHGR